MKYESSLECPLFPSPPHPLIPQPLLQCVGLHQVLPRISVHKFNYWQTTKTMRMTMMCSWMMSRRGGAVGGGDGCRSPSEAELRVTYQSNSSGFSRLLHSAFLWLPLCRIQVLYLLVTFVALCHQTLPATLKFNSPDASTDYGAGPIIHCQFIISRKGERETVRLYLYLYLLVLEFGFNAFPSAPPPTSLQLQLQLQLTLWAVF